MHADTTTPAATASATITLDQLQELMADWRKHVATESPREACGVVTRLHADGRLVYLPARNLALDAAGHDRFELDPQTLAHAEEIGTVLAICHSHPHADANPSEADLVMCDASGVSWAIMGWPSEVIKLAHPGYQAPLIGRSFSHGILDCYTLVQDYYARNLGIKLPSFERADNWWVAPAGGEPQNLYLDNFAKAGFVQINGQPRLHDGLLMQVLANVSNHAAVYLGDGRILQHLHGRLSGVDVYGGYWLRHTSMVLRHRSLLQPGDQMIEHGAIVMHTEAKA